MIIIHRAITHLPRMFLPLELVLKHQNELVAMELRCIMLTSQLAYTAGVFQALWLVGLVAFIPCISNFGKSVLNKLVYKLERMDYSCSLLCKNILYIYIVYMLPFKYWIFFNTYFHLCNNFWVDFDFVLAFPIEAILTISNDVISRKISYQFEFE